jgi:hypothetical protein
MSDPLEQSSKAYQQGRKLLESGDLQGAIAQFETSISLSPHFKSLELLGEALIRSGQAVRAIVPLAAATTLNAQVRAPSLLAEALLASGDPLKADEVANWHSSVITPIEGLALCLTRPKKHTNRSIRRPNEGRIRIGWLASRCT